LGGPFSQPDRPCFFSEPRLRKSENKNSPLPRGGSASASLLLPSLALTMLPTHSVGASGSHSVAPLPFVCCHLLIVLPPPVVHRRIHLYLLPCLHLLSQLCIALRPSHLVGCRISQCLSLSLSSRLCPAPWRPPFIMPQPFIAPLSFGWMPCCPAPQPSSRCNSAWCLGLRLLLIPRL
jgi:hypothetical protein